MLRHLPGVFVGLALAMFVAAGLAYWQSWERPGFMIVEAEREFSDAAVGKVMQLTFTLNNPTWHSVRIVGRVEC